ncbi:unnamed protein product, partial [marine sediment metagenome]
MWWEPVGTAYNVSVLKTGGAETAGLATMYAKLAAGPVEDYASKLMR